MITEPNQDGELTGRELSLQMAKLMGWTRCGSGSLWENKVMGHHPVMEHRLPKWISSIANAMEIVSQMKEWNFTLLLNRAIAPECGQWVAWFENFITGKTVHVGATTAAEAICRAALVATKETTNVQ